MKIQVLKGRSFQLTLLLLMTFSGFNGYSQSQLQIQINGTSQLTEPAISGGIPDSSGGYKTYTFNSSSTLVVPFGYNITAEALIVAGGGGGGYRHAGGGGAGGVVHLQQLTLNTTSGGYTANVTIGNGGTGSNSPDIRNGGSGGNSSISGNQATGGGGGGTNGVPGNNGGSGGGGSNGSAGGSGTALQGNAGGNQNNGQGCCYAAGAGGGGYGVAGASTNAYDGSNGGAGGQFNISGTSTYYAGGGGGGLGSNANNGASYTGGAGGGGNGGNPYNLNGQDGVSNSGGGGGGGGAGGDYSGNGGSGGSGIVIVRYLASAGVWSSSNTGIATVNASTGVVTGVSPGTVNLVCTNSSGTFTTTYTQAVKVMPGKLPVMTVPSSIALTLPCGTVPAPNMIPYTNGLTGASLVSGNSDNSTFTTNSGMSGGTITETWTATDKYGRTLVPVSVTITISPAVLPVMIAPANITVAFLGIPPATSISYSNSSGGGCLDAGLSMYSTFTAAPYATGGTVTETWTGTDELGRPLAPVSRTITVLHAAFTAAQMVATNLLSPNGDGMNDTWVVNDILYYQYNSVTVYDRLGRVVFYKTNYKNDWGGTLHGTPLNEDTYYYLVDYGPGERKVKGFFSLVRDH